MLDEDFYQILDVSENASAEEIIEAYRKLAFRYHPDRNQMSPAAHERMKDINQAYAILSDPTRRKEYDLSRLHIAKVPMFKMGARVRVRSDSASFHKGRTGVVEKEPVKDNFRFWYMVKFQSIGLATVARFAEDELEKAGD